ncbi:MAG: 4Fe-4S binding protein [Planctomycetes bacterium]|nr:4Fe-4S binding protein [Planctomycetota bacterium]
MAVRNIVRIDEDKCTGCGQCATACAEGAIQIVDGKARLVSDSYCDGLGACLGHCPEGAITIEPREAAEFDEKAVQTHLARPQGEPPSFVCPGMTAHQFQRQQTPQRDAPAQDVPSELTHWPIQLALVSPTAPQFADADLLLAADCVPFAVGDFHRRFLKDHSLIIGCPKLDDTQSYSEKLTHILRSNNIRSLMVVHMEVPCCFGLTHLAREAIARSGKAMSFLDITVSLRGSMIRSEVVKMEPVVEAKR